MIKLRHDEVTWRDVNGDIVILHLGDSTYFSLNGTASVLWLALNDGVTQEHLIDLLVDRFDVDAAVAAADVDLFLEELRTRRLID